jgi:hypothetical protein
MMKAAKRESSLSDDQLDQIASGQCEKLASKKIKFVSVSTEGSQSFDDAAYHLLFDTFEPVEEKLWDSLEEDETLQSIITSDSSDLSNDRFPENQIDSEFYNELIFDENDSTYLFDDEIDTLLKFF